MANKCMHCGKFPNDSAKCTKCLATFYRACATGFDYKSMSKWSCRGCKGKVNKSPAPLDEAAPEDMFLDAGVEADSPLSLGQEIRLLREVMTSMRKEMQDFRQELVHLNSSMHEFNKRVESVEQRVAAVEERIGAQTCTHEANPDVINVITQLKQELNDREQENLLNNIQITGIPEKNGENVVHLVDLITKKIGVDIDARDIVSAERRGSKRASPGGDETKRPRPIIVRLTRRSVRDAVLKAARVRRGTDTNGIIDGPPSRLYINEHLTRTNRVLFYKAREEGRRLGWRYVWTRGGGVFVRRESGTTVHRIKTELDIHRIFGIDCV
ncbi:unnamed protein product [Euphydryas editha]|uniref:FP protein C-terminal domain-containing protein n=1 Tax=Euphydryas editha TaxID=104508 RepID=A0AAU9VEK1_EUPED|nr:unnamed protein product [Euphydryas editha]